MARSRNLPIPFVLTAGLLALSMIVLYIFQLRDARHSAGRMVGMYYTTSDDEVRIDEVVPGEPASGSRRRPVLPDRGQ